MSFMSVKPTRIGTRRIGLNSAPSLDVVQCLPRSGWGGGGIKKPNSSVVLCPISPGEEGASGTMWG